MNIPENLKYTASHEWVEDLGDGVCRIGITDHAQEELGDIVFVELPEEGAAVTAGEAFADVESVKAASEVYSPVTGTVREVNAALPDAPEMINEDAYGAWFVVVVGVTETKELLDAAAYKAAVEEAE